MSTPQKRQILVTLVEIALPLLFSGILIVLRQKVPFQDYPNATVYNSFSVNVLPKAYMNHLQLAYVPGNSSVVRQVVDEVRRSLYLTSGEYWLGKEMGKQVEQTMFALKLVQV